MNMLEGGGVLFRSSFWKFRMSGLLIIAVSGLASATASRKSDADARLSYSALVQDITFTVKGGLHEPIMNVTLDGVRQTIVRSKRPHLTCRAASLALCRRARLAARIGWVM